MAPGGLLGVEAGDPVGLAPGSAWHTVRAHREADDSTGIVHSASG